MAAQMLVVGFRGDALTEDSPIIKHIRAGLVGNVIIFERDLTAENGAARNVSSPEQLRTLIRTLKHAAVGNNPLWVLVDQEGGAVQRLRPSRGFRENYPSAEELGKGTAERTRQTAERIGRELAEISIDMDAAPVADVNVNPASPAIGALGRSFSADPAIVAEHAAAFAEGLRASGIVPCVKHFPGHGSAGADSHEGAADVTGTWQECELEPYRRLFAAGWQGAVMSAHIFNANMDERHPASLSRAVMTGLLRGELGWDGVIVTDDLHMNAITERYTLEESLRLAVEAGADMLLLSGNSPGAAFDPDMPRKAHRALVALVKNGSISRQRLSESWGRIIRLKSTRRALFSS